MKKGIEEKVKPKVELKNRDCISVNVPTPEKLKALLRIYELAGGITWINGDPLLPLDFGSFFLWTINSSSTYILLEDNKISFEESYGSNRFSFQEFYKSIGLSQKKLREIDNYFKKK
jgi:hypothetical protein